MGMALDWPLKIEIGPLLAFEKLGERMNTLFKIQKWGEVLLQVLKTQRNF